MKLAMLFLALLATWLLWSGLLEPLVIGLGVISCAICVLVIHRMHRHGPEVFELGPLLRAVGYLPWLLKEVAVSTWNVVCIVLNPRLPIDPVVVKVRASQRSQLGRVVYANSITLTPGTLTMDEDGGYLTVHALTAVDAHTLQRGEMDARVCRVEGS